MSDLYKFGYTLDETIKTMRDVIDTGNHDRMFLDTYYWLKMLSEYREIGTVEECREAVEKQKPMKVNEVHVDEYYCPACGSENCCDQGKVYDKYCPVCGRAIYQEESEEE